MVRGMAGQTVLLTLPMVFARTRLVTTPAAFYDDARRSIGVAPDLCRISSRIDMLNPRPMTSFAAAVPRCFVLQGLLVSGLSEALVGLLMTTLAILGSHVSGRVAIGHVLLPFLREDEYAHDDETEERGKKWNVKCACREHKHLQNTVPVCRRSKLSSLMKVRVESLRLGYPRPA
jgi:hypothetical protein